MKDSSSRRFYFLKICRIIALILAFSVMLSACVRLVEPESESISVYATFWPIYALADAAMDGVPDAALKLLVQPQDGCLRDYQLSDWDAELLARDADAVIMGGRGLESFESLLFGWGESGPAVSAVLYNLELYNQDDLVDGEAESHLRGANPHLYMSIEGAQEIVKSASAMLQSMDPQYAGQYAANAQSAVQRLDALLLQNREALKAYSGKGVALMNEALVYVARDYDLAPVAWIDRESGENLVDRELEDCLGRLEASGARVVLIERQAPKPLVAALEAAGYAVARLDVFSTRREGEGFDAYVQAQAENARSVALAFARAESWEASD